MKDYELGPLILSYYDKFDGMWIQFGLVFLLTILMLLSAKMIKYWNMLLLISGLNAILICALIPINLLYILFSVHSLDDLLSSFLISLLYLVILKIIFILFDQSNRY